MALALAVAMTLVLAIELAFVWSRFQTGEREGLAHAELYARVLNEHVTRTLGTTSRLLTNLAASDLYRQDRADQSRLQAALPVELAGHPVVRGLALLDETGRVLASTAPNDLDRVIDLTRLVHPSWDGEGTHLGPMLPVRELSELIARPGDTAMPHLANTLPMVLKVHNGRAVHWLVALIHVDYFGVQHAVILQGEGVRALLLSRQGLLWSSSQESPPPGASLAHLMPFGTPLTGKSSVGTFVGSGSDGDAVVASYRLSQQWPAMVMVEQPRADLVERWWVDIQASLRAMLVILTLLGALAWVVNGALRARAIAASDIDELNRAVGRSEARWRLALETAGHGVWDLDLAHRRIRLSALLCATLGLAPPSDGGDLEVDLDDLSQHLVPEDLAGAKLALANHLRGETSSFRAEFRVRGAGEESTWLVCRGQVAGSQTVDGQWLRIIGTATDVTDVKHAEAALRNSELHQLAIVESALDAIVSADAEGRIVMFNPAATRMFGWEAAEVVGKPLSMLMPKQHRDRHTALMRLLPAAADVTTRTMGSVVHGLRRSGAEFLIQASVSRMAQNGRDAFIAILRDVTEQERTQKRLRRSEERIRSTFDQAAVGMVELRADRIILAVNRAFRALIGASEAAVLGMQLEELVLPDDQDALISALNRLAHGEARDETLELRCRRRSGSPAWVRMTVSAVQSVETGSQHLIALVEDISDRRRAQMDLEAARQRELQMGEGLQRALLVVPPDQRLTGLWLSVLSRASEGADGDFIDVISLDDQVTDIVCGDVMGKGLAAALIGAAMKMHFSRCLAQRMGGAMDADHGVKRWPRPADIVAAVSAEMSAELQTFDAFVTVSYIRIDRRAQRLTWVGCGHEEALVFGPPIGGTVARLDNQQPPIGIHAGATFEQDECAFEFGSSLLMASDGLSDAVLPDGSRVGQARVIQIASTLRQTIETPSALLHALRREIEALGARFVDDLTLALATPSRHSRRELKADVGELVHVRGLVGHRARLAGLDDLAADLFALACVEAYTNAVRHTVGRPDGAHIEVVSRVGDGAIEVDVVTLGEPFTPPGTTPAHDPSSLKDGGYGLSMMSLMADSVVRRHGAGVNTVTLTKQSRSVEADSGG